MAGASIQWVEGIANSAQHAINLATMAQSTNIQNEKTIKHLEASLRALEKQHAKDMSDIRLQISNLKQFMDENVKKQEKLFNDRLKTIENINTKQDELNQSFSIQIKKMIDFINTLSKILPLFMIRLFNYFKFGFNAETATQEDFIMALDQLKKIE